MKRFLMALAVTSVVAFGSANASSLNWFKFTDTADDQTFSSYTVSGAFSEFTLQWWDDENATGATALQVESGPFLNGEAILGDVVYTATTDQVTWSSGAFAGTPTTGTGSLPGGYFSLGLLDDVGTAVALQSIALVDAGAGRYDLTFANEQVVGINNVSQVPIPAAAVLFMSGIGGLLLIARRNSTRNKRKHPAFQPLLA